MPRPGRKDKPARTTPKPRQRFARTCSTACGLTCWRTCLWARSSRQASNSGALVGLMRDVGQQDIQTVTLAFGEFQGGPEDEAPLAEQVARLYGTQHTTRVVTEAEFKSNLPLILDAMDQPSIDGINTWFVSKAAHELGLKVAISGLGGDELFGGYPSFRDIPRWVSRLRVASSASWVGRVIREALCASGISQLAATPKAAGLVEYGGTYPGAYLLRRGLFMPWELNQVLDPEVVRIGLDVLQPLVAVDYALTPRPKSEFAQVAALELLALHAQSAAARCRLGGYGTWP